MNNILHLHLIFSLIPELKYFLVSDLERIFSKEEFEERKNTFKSINEVMSHLLNNEEMSNADYVDELDYETYLKWFVDFAHQIKTSFIKLTEKINSVVKLYFDKENVTYTAKEVKKILSDTDIYTLEKGFGGD